MALARHLTADHHDDRGGNGSVLHARHCAHHGMPLTSRHPHPLPEQPSEQPSEQPGQETR